MHNLGLTIVDRQFTHLRIQSNCYTLIETTTFATMTPSLITQWHRRKDAKKSIKKKLQRLEQHTGKHLDRLADAVHEEVFAKVDCLDCANCCTTIPPIVNRTDSDRIARHLGMSSAAFHEKYLVTDEDGDTVMKTVPCVFLGDGHHCEIYDVRPKACRQYPHTDGSEFSKHMDLHRDNVMHCPAVWHIVEELERRMP